LALSPSFSSNLSLSTTSNVSLAYCLSSCPSAAGCGHGLIGAGVAHRVQRDQHACCKRSWLCSTLCGCVPRCVTAGHVSCSRAIRVATGGWDRPRLACKRLNEIYSWCSIRGQPPRRLHGYGRRPTGACHSLLIVEEDVAGLGGDRHTPLAYRWPTHARKQFLK